MENYVDPASMAENAGAVRLSREKFAELRDDILKVSGAKKAYFNKQYKRISQYLQNGDTQPAVVASVSPLIVSAYSDEMDAVVFLRFPDELTAKYGLQAGTRLVTSCVYTSGDKIAKDLRPGQRYLEQFSDVTPVVQLFLSDEEAMIRARTELFNEDVWSRVTDLTQERTAQKIAPRDGFGYFTEFNLLFMIF